LGDQTPRWSKQVKPLPQPIGPLFEEVAAEGYRMVEWRSPTRNGVTVPETDLLASTKAAEEIRAVSEALGISLAYHAPQGGEWDFGVQPHEVAVPRFRESIRRAASIGARVMTFHLGVVVGEDRDEAILRGSRVVRDQLSCAEDADVTLCVENVFDEHSVATVADCSTFFEAADSGKLRFALDTGHGHLCGCLHDLAEAFGDRLGFTHVHDNHGINDGHGDRHLVPGRGTIDWPRLIRGLNLAGYSGPISFELRESATLEELIQIWESFQPHC
jgi:sugar phosphate isomerase/epimerase